MSYGALWAREMEAQGILVRKAHNAPNTERYHVLQTWTQYLTARMQGVLVLSLRGPDGMPKEHPCKNLIRSYRACVMNSGRERAPMALGKAYDTDRFMRMDLIADPQEWAKTQEQFFSCIDQYNLHFFQHMMHAAMLVGFYHPIPLVRDTWHAFYLKCCSKLHVKPETEEDVRYRLRDGIREEDSVRDYTRPESITG